MSISSENRKAGPYSGNSSATSFTFGFKVFQASDLLVVHTDSAGVEHVLTLGTDYTVSLNADQGGSPGGSVTYPLSGSALPPTDLLTITSQVANLQAVVLTNNGGFFPAVINAALDRLTILVQQALQKIGRTITVPISDPSNITMQLPQATARANKAIVFDGSGNIGVSVDNYVNQAANAASSATAAATSAGQAATSATAAATSAGNAHTSEINAGNSASQAATSAANAQAAASSVGFRNVKFLTYANSPYTVQAADSGYLISVDTSGGNVVVNLPAISGLVLPYSIGFKKSTSDTNTLTINCGGTDKFDSGSASKTISTGGAGSTLIPEANTTPDEWVASDWGAMGGQVKKQQFVAGTDFTAGTSTSLTLTATPLPGSAQSLEVYFDAAYQQGSEWSYNPTTGVITFNSAIPSGVQKIETRWSTPLVVGAPADGTVTGAKIASGDAANIRAQIGLGTAATQNTGTGAGNIPQLDGSGKMPAVDGSQLTGLMVLGIGQTWQDVTASRAAGTTYTNNTGRPIMVRIHGFGAAAAECYATMTMNGVAVRFCETSGTVGATHGSDAIVVPAGATYVLALTSLNLSQWYELR